MQQKWLIAVDLDGTLFNTDHQVSSRTLNAMHVTIEYGHSIVVVTGRSSHTAIPRLLSIPDGIRIICSNGAYEYDRDRELIVWAYYIPADKTIDMRQRILKGLPSASFGWESKLGHWYEPKFITEAGGAHTLEQSGEYESGEIASENSESENSQHCDVLKLLVRTPELQGGELAVKLLEMLEGECEVSSSGAPFAEITANGVNKDSALAKVASDMGIGPDCTIAFGDNQNDVPMLRWAGESVAMGNAIDEVKTLAAIHTLSNSEDGVAAMLESKFNV